MYIVERKAIKGSKLEYMKISRPECFKMTSLDRFLREAMGAGSFDNDSNYTIDNWCFWRVITLEAVTLYHIGTIYTYSYTYIVHSSLLYNGITFCF